MPDEPAPKPHWLANLGLWLLAGFSLCLFLGTLAAWIFLSMKGGWKAAPP